MNSAGWESFDGDGDPVKGLAYALIFDGLLVIALFGILSLVTCIAEAQDERLVLPTAEQLQARCAPEVEGERRGGRMTVVVDGTEIENAAWFHPDVVRCMTVRLGLLPSYATLVGMKDVVDQERSEIAVLQERRAQLAERGEARAAGSLEAAERGRREAEEDRDAWWNAKGLWVGVGAVAVIVLEAVSLWIYGELKDGS